MSIVTETAVSSNPAYQQSSPQEQQSAASHEQMDSEASLEAALGEKSELDSLKNQVEEKESEELKESKPKDDDAFSSKFAALSRKEKSIREREAQLESKLAEIEQKLEMLNKPAEPEKEPELPLEYRLKKDPLSALAELGLSYDKLTQLALNDGKLTPEMQMELMRQEIDQKYSKEIESLKNDLAEREKRFEEEKYNEVVTNFKSELTNYINDSDEYELIRANDAADVVFQVIEEHYNETGRILSKKEAADQVESYLEEEFNKLLKLNKLKSKLGISEAPKQSTEPNQTQKVVEKTLSNAHSAAASKPSRPLTRDESLAQAASLLKWND